MKKNTIKFKIVKYNILLISLLVILVAVIFNIAVRKYMENDIIRQLNKIESHTENTALQKGPDFFPKKSNESPPPPKPKKYPTNPPPPKNSGLLVNKTTNNNTDPLRFYFMLDRSLKDSATVLNANYILLDVNKKRITPTKEESSTSKSSKIMNQIMNQTMPNIKKLNKANIKTYLHLHVDGVEYITLIQKVSKKNSFDLGWIIVYSNLQKINQLQLGITLILFIILILSATIVFIFSSIVAKKISEPFSSLNEHIRTIAERNFGAKIDMPVYDDLQDFVDNINIMSEKLEVYDKAQKTFLQNASHEFRTPLMSIQSYAEGIKYSVIDNDTAVNIILDETKRMTNLVEDLLYLSRLEAIDENYHFNNIYFSEFTRNCINRMNGIALKNNIKINNTIPYGKNLIRCDEEKLSRAITNVISNCIKYAHTTITISAKLLNTKVEIYIADDGPGIDEKDLPNIFERFYKGKKGNFGLGLAISQNIIEKHNGKISALPSTEGALFKIELPII